MSRTVLDSAIFMQVMAGPHPDDPGSNLGDPPDFVSNLDDGVKGLRMAWSRDLGSGWVDPEVAQIVEKAASVFQELGATVEPARLHFDFPELQRINLTLVNVGHYLANGPAFEEHADLMMDYVQANIKNGKAITGIAYATAMSELEQLRAKVAEFFTHYDVLLTPTLSVAAFPCGQRPSVIGDREIDSRRFSPFTFAFNMTGNSAASVPCGFSSDGLPIGLHIVGRRFDEVTVFQASAAFEMAQPWAQHRPPVS